jgi:hypothetical protein
MARRDKHLQNRQQRIQLSYNIKDEMDIATKKYFQLFLTKSINNHLSLMSKIIAQHLQGRGMMYGVERGYICKVVG